MTGSLDAQRVLSSVLFTEQNEPVGDRRYFLTVSRSIAFAIAGLK